MSFLKSIGKIAKKVGKKFLSTATGGISDAVFGAIGGKIKGAINPSDNRVSQADNTHAQNLLDQNNPREIARQSSFLTGIAPAQASAYNTYQDATYGQDTARQIERTRALAPVEAETDLAYMDTVYAGTSPWERLGSSAAPSLSAPEPSEGPPSSNGAGAHSQFLPLLSTQMQTENAKEIALIQAQNAKDIAEIQTGAQLQAVGIQTDNGNLPRQQSLESASRVLLQGAQTWESEARAGKTQVETEKVRQDMAIGQIATFLSASPKEIIDLGLIKYEHRPGWENLLPLLSVESNPQTRKSAIEDALKKMPPDQFSGMKRDIIEIAAMVSKGSQTLAHGGKFLSGIFKGKNTRDGSQGKRKFVDTSGKTHWLDN